MKRPSLAAVAVIFAVTPALAQGPYEVYPLTDTYAGFGYNGQINDQEMGFIFGGDFARALYDRMPAAPQPDACTGGTIKTDRNGMSCTLSDGAATCSFGYGLNSGAISAGPLIC